MAEQLERNGAAFYRRAATADGLATDQQALLLRLASMEDDHEQTFREMRAELTGKEKAPTVFDPDGEAALYLRASSLYRGPARGRHQGIGFRVAASPASP